MTDRLDRLTEAIVDIDELLAHEPLDRDGIIAVLDDLIRAIEEVDTGSRNKLNISTHDPLCLCEQCP